MDNIPTCTPAARILVTGALGNVGREVVRALLARGTPTRAVDLCEADVRALHGEELEVRTLDYSDSRTFESSIEGCKGLFLIRPPPITCMEETLLPFIDAAIEGGIEHIVFLSVIGGDANKLVPHYAVEKYLAARRVNYTLLRPAFFAQNLGVAYREDIAEESRLFLPAGRGRVAFVDIRDVAEVGAAIFDNPEPHRGAAYTCTGGEALSFEETARLMSDVIHRSIRYEAASIAGYVRHLHLRGMPLAQIAVQTVLHVGLRFDYGELIDPTLEHLLGRRPRTLATYVRESADLWTPTKAPLRPRLPPVSIFPRPTLTHAHTL